MAASLFEQIKSLAPPEVVDRLAGGLGETPQATERALSGAAMPAVLGGLVQQFSSGTGPGRLLGLIKQQDPGGRLLDNIQAGLGGATPGAPAGASGAAPAEIEHAGQGVIGSLFGQRSDHVADAVAAHAGVKKTSAMSLLSISGAMILGWLGHRVARGLDANELGAMLSSARGELGRIAPPGLAAAIGAPAAATAAAEPVREPLREPVREPTCAASATGAREAIYRDEAVDRRPARAPGRRGLSWLIPLLIVLGLAAWLISRFHGATPPVTPNIVPQQVTPQPAPTTPQTNAPQTNAPQTTAPQAAAPAAPNANAPAANAPAPTANAPTLNFAPNAVAAGIASYLGATNAPAVQRFTLRNMTFPTAGSVLTPQAQSDLNNVAAVLKSHPSARVQVQGFTDTTGSPQANLALSGQRAMAVRSALVQRGVAPDHVTAQGFGESHPVANNATPAGRALNRRTDLVVSR